MSLSSRLWTVIHRFLRTIVHSSKLCRLCKSRDARYAVFMQLYGSLNNYIEMYRRRAALSQTELAVLLGADGPGSVSRIEKGTRIPTLEELLALEVISEQPIQKLFAGVAEGVTENLSVRAAALLESTTDARPDPRLARKLAVLSRLARQDDVQFIPTWEPEE